MEEEEISFRLRSREQSRRKLKCLGSTFLHFLKSNLVEGGRGVEPALFLLRASLLACLSSRVLLAVPFCFAAMPKKGGENARVKQQENN